MSKNWGDDSPVPDPSVMFHSFPSLSMAFHPFLPFLMLSTGCPGVLSVSWRVPKVVVGEGTGVVRGVKDVLLV